MFEKEEESPSGITEITEIDVHEMALFTTSDQCRKRALTGIMMKKLVAF